MDFTGQAVVVAGAGGNLGAAIARDLSARGARLVLAGGGVESLQTTMQTLASGATAVIVDGVDLRKDEDAARVAQTCEKSFGRIDALANTVGAFRMGRIDENASENWALLMDLNLRSALALARAVLPAMQRASYGRILNTAAGAGLRGVAGLAAYSASKAALMRLTESLADEQKAAGITANCILPGVIDTPQNRAAMPNADDSSWIKPDAIAKAAAFLLSREGGVVTGANVPVTGRG